MFLASEKTNHGAGGDGHQQMGHQLRSPVDGDRGKSGKYSAVQTGLRKVCMTQSSSPPLGVLCANMAAKRELESPEGFREIRMVEKKGYGRKLSGKLDYFTSMADFIGSFTKSKRGVMTALLPFFAKLVFNNYFNKVWVVYPKVSIIFTQLPKAAGWQTDSSGSRKKRGVIMTGVLLANAP